MKDTVRPPVRLLSRLQSFSRGAGIAVAALGVLVAAGWIFDMSGLRSPFTRTPMQPDTALALSLAGAALWCGSRYGAGRARRIAGTVLGVVVAVIGLLTVAEHFTGSGGGIHQVLAVDRAESSEPGRSAAMPPATAFGLLVSGVALALISARSLVSLAQVAGLTVLLGTVVLLVGYFYGVSALRGQGPAVVPLSAVFAFLLLSLGILCARPADGFLRIFPSDTGGGAMSRRLLPLAALVPLVTGWVELVGLHAGLYDPPFAMAVFAVVNSVVLVALIARNAVLLHRRDVERLRARDQLQLREHEARKSELRKQAVLESALDCIVTMDREGRVVDFNPAAERTFGYRKEEIVGKAVADTLVPPHLRESHRSGLARIRAGQPSRILGRRVEFVAQHRSGACFPVEIAVVGIEHGDLFTAYIRDISERQRAEKAIRDSEAGFRHLADSMPQIVWTAGPGGGIEYFNRRWYEYTGLPRGSGAGLEAVLHPDDLSGAIETWREAVRSGKSYEMEYRLRRHSTSEYRWHLGRALPVSLREGGVSRWFGTCTDIHDQKEAQKRLEEQANQLEQADRRKDEFLAVLGHELRNPLACIDSAVRLMRQSQREEHFEWAAETIASNVDQLVSLLTDLLDITRISRGKITLRRRKVTVASVISRAVESARPVMEERRHEFTVSLPPQSIWVDADPTRIEQVVSNLLLNAAKYTEEGGAIDLAADVDGSDVLIKVRDTGSGIPPEMLDRVFDPFTQVRKDTYTTHGGLGIGLSLVRQLVELHGGKVWARSEGPSRGTEFLVRLPIADKPVTDRPESKARAPRRLPHGVRVLVVDDNIDAARGLSVILKLCGCDVQTVHDGRSALEAARIHRPDAMLVDIGLPDINGYEVAREVRKQTELAGTLLVAVSGYGHEEARRTSREAGFDHHLPKPADMDVLLSLLAGTRRTGEPKSE